LLTNMNSLMIKQKPIQFIFLFFQKNERKNCKPAKSFWD
jgi:hypothetical protein